MYSLQWSSLFMLVYIWVRWLVLVLGIIGQYRLGRMLGMTDNRHAFVLWYNFWHLARMSALGIGYQRCFTIGATVLTFAILCMLVFPVVWAWSDTIWVWPLLSLSFMPLLSLCIGAGSVMMQICGVVVLYGVTKRLGYGVFVCMMLALFYLITIFILSLVYKPRSQQAPIL